MRILNRTVSFGMGLAVLSSSFGAIAAPLPSSHSLARPETPPPMPAELPELVARRIKLDLASRTNIPTSQLKVLYASVASWSNDCLELAYLDEACKSQIVQGWEVIIQEEDSSAWRYRTDRVGRRLRLDLSSQVEQSDFSAELSQKLLNIASEQLQQPISHLRLGDIQAVIWDNECLGITDAGMSCAQATISGFRAIVRNGSQDWVYHLSADGSQIVRNTTTSDAKGKMHVFFTNQQGRDALSGEPLSPDSPVIFQGQYLSWLEDSITTTALTVDGKVTATAMSLEPGSDVPLWETQYQVAPEAVAALQLLLKQNRFSSFDRTGYLTREPVIFEGEYIITAAGTNVKLSYTEAQSLPEDLQPIVEAWEKIAF